MINETIFTRQAILAHFKAKINLLRFIRKYSHLLLVTS